MDNSMHIGKKSGEDGFGKRVQLSEALHEIRRGLLTSGVKKDDKGHALPSLEISTRQLGELVKRAGIPVEDTVELTGALTEDDIKIIHADPQYAGRYPGLRSGFQLEHDGKPKVILLNATTMGGRSGMLTGQTPFIQVILQPGYREPPKMPEASRNKRRANGHQVALQ